MSDDEEQDTENSVQNVWSKISHEDHRASFSDVEEESSDKNDIYHRPSSSGIWTTVTLFISSTFRDMNAEREYIVKKVIPELADWAEKLGIRVVECDLRWGVPKDSTSISTIETCLGELDVIKATTKGQPLFLCLLGDRYGWIPDIHDIPDGVIKHYDWVDKVSITHMEILQGAIRCKNRNALFCFRTPEFSGALPAEKAEPFVDTGLLEVKQLTELKQQLPKYLPDPEKQIYIYDAELADPDSVSIEFKPEFGEKVLEFFKKAIEDLFPDRATFKRPDDIETENFYQWTYLERRVTTTFGVDTWTQELASYISQYVKGDQVELPYSFSRASPIVDSLTYEEHDKSENERIWPPVADPESEWTSRPICLISDPGQGKTSLLSCVAQRLISSNNSGEYVFFHSCGMTVSDKSTSYDVLLGRVNQFLKRLLGDVESDSAVGEEDIMEEMALLLKLLERLQSQKDKKLVIMIDAPENIESIGTVTRLHWFDFLPIRFPSNCVIFMSASTDEFAWIHKYLHLCDANLLQMPVAPLELRSIIATKFFEAYNKRLDSEQLNALINKEGAYLPLWLKLACDELRVFGNFRQVTSKIKAFDSTLEGLLFQIFSRLINEFPELPIGKLLCYMAVCAIALPSEELPQLLRNSEEEQPILPLDMARIRLVLKPFIKIISGFRTILLPFHAAFTKTARKLCQLLGTKEKQVKKDFAFYMMNQANGNNRHDWTYHIVRFLWEVDCREELLRFLQYDKYGHHYSTGIRMIFINKFRCPMTVIAAGQMTVAFKSCSNCAKMMNFELNARPIDVCWVCKLRLASPSFSSPALACASHPECSIGVGQKTCRVCNRFKPDNEKWEPLKLCIVCAAGGRCCFLSVEQSLRRYPIAEDEDNGNNDDDEKEPNDETTVVSEDNDKVVEAASDDANTAPRSCLDCFNRPRSKASEK